MAEKNPYTSTHGRRKGAVARARLFKGRGITTVNGKPYEEYFPSVVAQSKINKLFGLLKEAGDHYLTIRVDGSGKNSQLTAVIHSIARTYTLENKDFRPTIKKAGYLTRDPRVRERRKFGKAQKARKGKQSPKR
ncbi:30S ribosomal protein S9 [Candidatus Curtissbacteria bacterium]|nr:30S ribosomal protein S9 [Candidatus Curtissbacteria bacterium]